MPTLTRLICPTALEPLAFLGPEATVDDVRLTMRAFTLPRPVPVGAAWGERWVWLVGGN